MHDKGIQHFRSAEPLIQRGNLIFFFGHVIRFPFFDSALFYRHPLPSTWGAASASPFAAGDEARRPSAEPFIIPRRRPPTIPPIPNPAPTPAASFALSTRSASPKCRGFARILLLS